MSVHETVSERFKLVDEAKKPPNLLVYDASAEVLDQNETVRGVRAAGKYNEVLCWLAASPVSAMPLVLGQPVGAAEIGFPANKSLDASLIDGHRVWNFNPETILSHVAEIKKTLAASKNTQLSILLQHVTLTYEMLEVVKKTAEIGMDAAKTEVDAVKMTLQIRAPRHKLKTGDITMGHYRWKIDEHIVYNSSILEVLGLGILVHERLGVELRFATPDHLADMERPIDMTVRDSFFTTNPVKSMLTGPVTILNCSFTRKDINRKDQTIQFAHVFA
eukprot:jgi/Phyca11/20574/fgenesh1_pg.PHYCAscaffold_67_\